MWYIIIPSIFLILTIIFICIKYYGAATFSLGIFILSCIVSVETYKKNNPKDTYQVVVINKFYYNTSYYNSGLIVKIIETGKVNHLYIDNLYDLEQYNIGDILTVKGWNEEYLQLK